MTTRGKIVMGTIAGALLVASVALASLVFPNDDASQPAPERKNDIRDYYTSLNADDFTLYTNDRYGFSFDYPNDFTLAEFSDGDAEVVLVECSISL